MRFDPMWEDGEPVGLGRAEGRTAMGTASVLVAIK
jgi:hypothetical protein